jgi:hypothetical protein
MARRRRRPSPAATLGALSEKRRKLLDLYYRDRISAEFFAEEERRLCADIEAARMEATEEQEQEPSRSDLEVRCEQVAAVLRDLDIEAVWSPAEEQDRRVLVEELVEWVSVFPDHLEVTVTDAPPLNVLLPGGWVEAVGFCWCRRSDAAAPPALPRRFRDASGIS